MFRLFARKIMLRLIQPALLKNLEYRLIDVGFHIIFSTLVIFQCIVEGMEEIGAY